MKNILKFGIGIAVLIALIALGLIWPTEKTYEEDLFVPGPIPGMLSSFGMPKLDVELADVVTNLHETESTREEIRSGKFKYRRDDLPWTFSVPIDWGKPPNELAVRRVLQRFVLADPFLKSYDETGNVEDFQQAAFFMLDWQAYYQTQRRTTTHSWDEDAVLARTERLAYVLARLERHPKLLNEDGTRSLIRLADFHIQRVTDPEFGMSQDTILQTHAFRALCDTLDDLTACPR